jgi:limonene 1,2-monooxygenase
VVASGRAVIGTPDDAVAMIERLQQKTGGFGTMLLLAHNWADFERTKHSYELFARHVLPKVNRANEARAQSLESYGANKGELLNKATEAVLKTMEKHQDQIRSAMAAKASEGKS